MEQAGDGIDAEMRSYMEHRYETALKQVDTRPFWQWVCIDDFGCCALCLKRHQRVFHYTDSIWQYLPPIHRGCRCRFRALTRENVEVRGLTVSRGDDFMDRQGKPC